MAEILGIIASILTVLEAGGAVAKGEGVRNNHC